MNLSTKSMVLLFILGVFLLMLSLQVCAEDLPNVIPITSENYPALLYIEENSTCKPPEFNRLMVATFVDGEVELREVVTAQHIRAVQLDDAVFMIGVEYQPEDCTEWSNSQYLVNFNSGRLKLLSESKSQANLVHLWCLRSWPDKDMAVILRYGQGTTETCLLHVDLKTLDTKEIARYAETGATVGFHSIHMKISPDCKLLATMSGGLTQKSKHARQRVYSLRILDLETLQTIVLDKEVMLEISVAASFSLFSMSPPFEWISPKEILYQHMISEDVAEDFWTPKEVQYVLKCADIANSKKEELFRNKMRLRLSGGKIHLDWLTNRLEYNDFYVDLPHRKLVKKEPCYHITSGANPKEIYFHNEPLTTHPPNPTFAQGCASFSEQNFAYFVGYDGKKTSSVYAKTNDMVHAVEVSKTHSYTTLVAWMEDTTPLRITE